VKTGQLVSMRLGAKEILTDKPLVCECIARVNVS